MIYNGEHNYGKTIRISPVDGTTKQKHVVNMNKRRKFPNHHCLRIKYTVIGLRKANMQIKYTIAVFLVASILQQIV